MGGHTTTQTDLQTETCIKWAKQGPTLRNGVQPRCVMDRSLEEEANIYQVLFSNDLQLGQTPSSLRDFDKLIRIITTQPVTNVVLLQNVRAPSTVPKSVVKPCSNYVEGWVLQSPSSAALLLHYTCACCTLKFLTPPSSALPAAR